MSKKLNSLVQYLRQSEPLHQDVWLRMVKADGGAVYPVDLLAYGVIHRSVNLVHGYSSLVEQRNFICAVPLLRLQMDNCLRFSAVFLVTRCHDFAIEVLKGKPVRKLRDRTGAFMTDAHLVRQLAQKHPWVTRVYERTSGYIHLSEMHFYNTLLPMAEGERDGRVLKFQIGPGDAFERSDVYEEATEAFVEATKILMTYLMGWVRTKEKEGASKSGRGKQS